MTTGSCGYDTRRKQKLFNAYFSYYVPGNLRDRIHTGEKPVLLFCHILVQIQHTQEYNTYVH